MMTWEKLTEKIKDNLNYKNIPDLNTMLVLIGIQETSFIQETYSKSEKEDLMHVAICSLFLNEHFILTHYDEEHWPHFQLIKSMPKMTSEEQEYYIKNKIIAYFSNNKLV
jgi:hypothetical protein